MDRQKQLIQYVKRAKRNLNLEKLLPTLQYGIFLSLLFSLAILIVSRFFVFPYYDDIALIVAGITFALTIIYFLWTHIRMKDALSILDSFYPFNELVTAFSLKDKENPLVDSILEKAVKESEGAFERFKKRPKKYWQTKVLFGILISSILMAVLFLFPSETQEEAQVVEKEKEIIRELEKEVENLEKKIASKDVQKELQELREKLKEVETSEEALREMIKKQKELKLREQKLMEKELAEGPDGLTEAELEMLKELGEVQGSLVKQASSTQSALSKLGKPVSFQLQNAIAKEMSTQSENSQTENQSSSQNNGQNQNQNQNGQSNSSQGNNSNAQGNQGQSNNSSNQSGGNQGQSQGQGSTGSGSGQGQGAPGSGQGQGSGGGLGSGAGLGSGDRNLLSVPNRIGGSSETTVDSGPLGEGNPAEEQKGPVPVTKGTVRPYEEVIGEYQESYMDSTERMQLPKDLQEVVESYFTSIQSDE